MAKYPYNTPEWDRARMLVLARDRRRCRLGYRGCLGVADAVDHVVSVRQLQHGDPALFDPANLVACCTPCNTRKRNAEARRRRAGAVDARRRTAGQGAREHGRKSSPTRPVPPGVRRVSRSWGS